MKKVIISLVFILVATLSFAQSKALEKCAQGMTKEMTKVLSLSQELESKIYEIHLEKFKKLDGNKANKSLTKEEHMEARKEIHSNSSVQFIALFDKEKWNDWVAYNKQKRESIKTGNINNY